jgi:penicillin amidase
MNLPDDWPHAERPVGFEWIENSRSVRIHEVLAADSHHSVAASCALQTDVLSVPARRVAPILEGLAAQDAGPARGLALLRGWDFRLGIESAAAALFEVWWTKHLKPALFASFVPDPELRKLLVPGDVSSLLAVLEHPGDGPGMLSSAERDELLIASLASAVRECEDRMGADMSGWAWGRLHHGYFEHALSGLAGSDRHNLDVGPLPKGGSGSTPMHAGYRPGDFRVIAGASVRIVMDVGDWDRSVCINAPGQSGDPRSPHYRDLAPLWAAGDYVPMLYSTQAIEAAAEYRIQLVPAAGAASRSAPDSASAEKTP